MGGKGCRRWLVRTAGALALLAGGGVARAQPAEPGRAPMVNLRVELRQAEAGQQSSARAGVAVSERGVAFGAGVQDSEAGRGVQQQVLVLNGGRAGLRIGQALPLQWWRAVPAGGGVTWVPGTVWVDAGAGFTVRPHWPGGAAPVTVEVAAESGGLESRGFGRGSGRSAQLLSTLQLPLGEWVTVAESVEEQQGGSSWGGRRQDGSHRLLVQMRVTAP